MSATGNGATRLAMPVRGLVLVLVLVLAIVGMAQLSAAAVASELSVFAGTGPQPGSDQRNRLTGIEYSFFTLQRSERHHLQLGVAYSRIQTTQSAFPVLRAISLYPQLTFYPPRTSRLALAMPEGMLPFFFARMLGPSYISISSLGQRNQASHFSFLGQFGAGLAIDRKQGNELLLTASWRHLSNANLASPNDGIDVPLVLSMGIRF